MNNSILANIGKTLSKSLEGISREIAFSAKFSQNISKSKVIPKSNARVKDYLHSLRNENFNEITSINAMEDRIDKVLSTSVL